MSEITSPWYPVALSSAVENSTSAGLRLHGKELVVWRDTAGRAHVWEDRCPHRGMKLSFGFVRGDHLACLYHGWQYDTQGQCRHIPAHPDLEVPATIKVPVYGAREWAGIIWARESVDPASGEIAEFPTTSLRSLYLELAMAEVTRLLENWQVAAYDGPAPVRFSSLADNLVSIEAGEDRLLIGLQPISENRTGLHVVLAGAADTARRKHYARALGTLRAETQAFHTQVAETA